MMPPTILPLYGLPFTGAGADAEQKTLNFLKALPDTYFVLRELRTYPSLQKRQAGSTEDRIDFVVIGPEIGVVVLEVKDWNIRRNSFEWPNQYNVIKRDEDGRTTHMLNPYAQVTEYRNAILDILKSPWQSRSVFVHDFVVFPKLVRADFENAFVKGQSGSIPNVQEKFLFDIQQTIFSDMLDRYWASPLELLKQLVTHKISIPYREEEVIQTVNVLIPPKLRVGDLSAHERGYEHLLLMDEKQQRWAFSDEVMSKNYMLDVAGSGKTNILLSRAMHLVNQDSGISGFRVLVLTYSEALARDLQRLLDLKIVDQQSTDAFRYMQTIAIRHIVDLMESILVEGLGEANADVWRTQARGHLITPEEYIEDKLPEKCQKILSEEGERFRMYDYLLVDEVQDFSDSFLDVALSLLKKRENVFMVGDAGQKLFDRSHNLNVLGLAEERTRVPASYQMYRSPKFIAQLAWLFLRHDRFIAYELQEHGYEEAIKPKNTITTRPIFKLNPTREALLKEVCDNIADMVTFRIRPQQVLCIALRDTLNALQTMLTSCAIPACWANEIDLGEQKVILAEYTMSKGLERDYVYILDVDRLPDGGLTRTSMFQPIEMLEQEARRSRIKIFVALTRAIREVSLYYTNPNNRFIQELLALKEQGERIR